jgi:hypothetical protein
MARLSRLPLAIRFFFNRLRLFESADENVDLFAVMALLICLWKADIYNFGNMDKQLKDMKDNKDASATEGLVVRMAAVDNKP